MAKKKAEKKEAAVVHLLPEGRVINHSLFKKDQFNAQATPAYKIELAFPKGALDDFFDLCLNFAVEKWGEGADTEEAGTIIPIIDGNKLADKREANGKPGDAYRDMDVIRANTIYNKNGEDGPGGIQVLNMDTSEVGPANAGEVYQGCFGIAAVTMSGYLKEGTGNDPDRNAITLYLAAFQKPTMASAW